MSTGLPQNPRKGLEEWDVCVLSTRKVLPLHLLEGGCHPLSSHGCREKCGEFSCSPLKTVDQPGWWKGKFALFQMPAGQGEDGGHLSKGRLTAPRPKHLVATTRARAFPDRKVRGSLYAETAQSSAIFCKENKREIVKTCWLTNR